MTRVAVRPDLLRWARERSGLHVEDLIGRFPKLVAWERGELSPTFNQLETFAKATQAEFLVPAAELQTLWPRVKRDASAFEMLAREFKVSPIVTGRRATDLGLTDRTAFFDFYDAYVQRERKQKPQGSGGSFYNNQKVRVGQLFAIQVMRAAKEGRIGFKDAYDLTGLHGGTFQEYARRLGVDLP
jgi:hypothetical protein